MTKIKTKLTTLILILIVFMACSDSTGPEQRDWQLVWQDEFDGLELDTTNWNYQIGDGTLYGLPPGWGNAQLEYATDRPQNVSPDGLGNLAIVARKEQYEQRNYTSARINTKRKLEQTYGRIEARMQLPWGQGIWPAFWMLGANDDVVGWPDCGEIDIMEYRGQEPGRVHGSLHGPGYSGANPITQNYDLVNDRFDTGFHTFAVEWLPDNIKWYVDGKLYQTVTPADLPGDWVFDHPFYIILNLAVGGNYVGSPDANTVFPQTMLIDYVRVYE